MTQALVSDQVITVSSCAALTFLPSNALVCVLDSKSVLTLLQSHVGEQQATFVGLEILVGVSCCRCDL